MINTLFETNMKRHIIFLPLNIISCIVYENPFVRFRKVVIEEGLFDQIRVDHGKEFYLTLYGTRVSSTV